MPRQYSNYEPQTGLRLTFRFQLWTQEGFNSKEKPLTAIMLMYQVSASNNQAPWAVSHQTQPSSLMNERCHIAADILYLLCCFTSGLTCSWHMGQLQPDARPTWFSVAWAWWVKISPFLKKVVHDSFMNVKVPVCYFGWKIVRCYQEETVGSLTHYWTIYLSVEVTFAYPQFCQAFSPKLHTSALTAILFTFVTQSTPTN